MIHLFKKVYVVSDKQLDLSFDRIVISDAYGKPMMNAMKNVFAGRLVSYGKDISDMVGEGAQFASWSELFKFANYYTKESGKKLVIYCDNEALVEVLCAWFNSVLPNSTEESVKNLINGILFRYNTFYKGRTNVNAGNTDYQYELNADVFADAYDRTKDLEFEADPEIISYAGVEFILATYLSTGKMKDELKGVLKPLIKKDLEKYFFEVKEIFFTHLLTRRFAKTLGLDKEYTYDNIADVLEDKSKFADLFLNSRIWSYKFMSHASSSKENINLEAITEEDIAAFKEFAKLATEGWNEEGIYVGVKSDVNKMDFLPIFKNFTDTRLDKIIKVESTFEHAAGTFFSIDLPAVNHYLIAEILEKNEAGDTDWIKRYSLV